MLLIYPTPNNKKLKAHNKIILTTRCSSSSKGKNFNRYAIQRISLSKELAANSKYFRLGIL